MSVAPSDASGDENRLSQAIKIVDPEALPTTSAMNFHRLTRSPPAAC